jgi:hypothetical protein
LNSAGRRSPGRARAAESRAGAGGGAVTWRRTSAMQSPECHPAAVATSNEGGEDTERGNDGKSTQR